MRFVCDSCSAQYMISDEKVGPKGVKVRCKKCGFVILVKKGGAAAQPQAQQARPPPPPPPSRPLPAPLGSDPDDGLATQVMQNPLVENPAATLPSEPDATNPGLGSQPGVEPKRNDGLFGGVDEDEIGAVFDQVLNSGAHSITNEALDKRALAASSQGTLGDDSDDRMSTRVLDAETVRKLAEDSGANGAASTPAAEKKDETPQTDWFVAIDDKQTGPLTIEQIKKHWEAGEVGPDSLCWRAGFDDWLPLSEVQMLASVLAPRPSKPVVVAHTPPVSAQPSVVSMPVESAFSAGAGVAASVRGEVAVALGVPPTSPEETGSWRPSAASALASLVKEEMEALAKPATPKRIDAGTDEVSVKGLLDLPPPSELSPVPATNGSARNGASAPAPRPPPPTNPYAANPGATYSSPGISQYRPPSNRNLMIGIGAAVTVVVLALMATVVWLATRQPGVAQLPPQQPQQPVAVAQAPVVAAPPPVVQPPVAAQPPAPVVAPPAGTPPPQPVAQPPVAVATAEKPAAGSSTPKRNPGATTTRVAAAERPAPAPKEPKEEAPAKPAARAADPDVGSFDDVFGTGKKDVPKQGTEAPPKKSAGYIPPAPGSGGDMLEKLSQSDVLEVVSAKKPELVKCADEQHSREPGVKGKLKMKWTIQTNGKTKEVSVVSDEFKSTYMAGCVGGLIKTWQFPKHKVAGEPIVFPFGF